MTCADYQRYVELFNANDPQFIDYHAPDVTFEVGATTCTLADGEFTSIKSARYEISTTGNSRTPERFTEFPQWGRGHLP
jgi:hypothetical protein